MGNRRRSYRVLVGRSRVKRNFGIPSRRWEDDIKEDILEVGTGGRVWTELIWFGIGTRNGLL
jgi:hypothetical protein